MMALKVRLKAPVYTGVFFWRMSGSSKSANTHGEQARRYAPLVSKCQAMIRSINDRRSECVFGMVGGKEELERSPPNQENRQKLFRGLGEFLTNVISQD